jgi:hypothetical protein
MKCFLISFIFIVLYSCSSDDDSDRPLQATTHEAIRVTHRLVEISGTVSGSNVDERGMVWNTIPNPTLDNNRKSAGSGTGKFMVVIDSLNRNTTYYFRAYAINGNEVVYGDNAGLSTSNFVGLSNGSHTIYVSPTDNALAAIWGPDTLAGAGSVSDGAANTQLLAGLTGNYVAQICAQYSGGGFTDWYLPSEEELQILRDNRAEIGNLRNSIYWSSTEVSDTDARGQNMLTGTVSNVMKEGLHDCRCIRKQ